MNPCKNHQGQVAAYHCENCKNDFCEPCISVRRITADFIAYVCKECGGKCEPLIVPAGKVKFFKPKVVGEKPGREKEAKLIRPAPEAKSKFVVNFWFSLLGSVFFPLKGRGVLTVPFLSVLFWGSAKFSSGASTVGLLAWVILATFFAVYLFKTAEDSFAGGNQLPGLPDFKYWIWMVKPSVLVGLASVACFAPANAYFFALQNFSIPFFILLGIGAFLFPMCLIKIVVARTFSALNPLAVVQSIFKTFFPYMIVCAFLSALIFLFYYLNLEFFAGYRNLGLGLKSLAMTYIAFVIARILGIFARRYQNKIAVP